MTSEERGKRTIRAIQTDVLLNLSHLELDERRLGVARPRMKVGEDLTRLLWFTLGVQPTGAIIRLYQLPSFEWSERWDMNIPLWAPEYKDAIESRGYALDI